VVKVAHQSCLVQLQGEALLLLLLCYML